MQHCKDPKPETRPGTKPRPCGKLPQRPVAGLVEVPRNLERQPAARREEARPPGQHVEVARHPLQHRVGDDHVHGPVGLPLPDVAEGETCAVVESVKAAADVFAPLAGKIVEVNETIVEDPSIVNSDAEGEGWFFRIELDDTDAFEALMDQDGYDEFLETL